MLYRTGSMASVEFSPALLLTRLYSLLAAQAGPESDTTRKAGGLMSGAASKAVVLHLSYLFRTAHFAHSPPVLEYNDAQFLPQNPPLRPHSLAPKSFHR